jgi:hypothetical protein
MSVGIGVSERYEPDLHPAQAGPEVLSDLVSPAEGRRELRVARRRRQRISVACVVLVAACTAGTLLLVALAR